MTVATAAAPFKLTGNVNAQRSHLFSTFAFHSDPVPYIPPVPQSTPVIPFTTTTLSLDSAPTLCFRPRPSLPSPPPSLSPPFPHPGLTSLRSRASPSHYPTAPPKSLSLSYHRDLHWSPDPLIEASPTHLHRSARPLSQGQRPWKATTASTTTSALFSDERGGWGVEERGRGRRVRGDGVAGRAEHAEGWRAGAKPRVAGDKGQLAGRVEAYGLSPFERTDGLKAGFAEEGMRSGYRAEGRKGLVPVRIGAHAKTLSSRRFHSSRSGVCRHNCQQGE